MNRRSYVAAAGTIAVTCAGCLESLSPFHSPTEIPSDMNVERTYIGDDILENGLFEELSAGANYGVILPDEESVDDEIDPDDPDGRTLIDETDFEESYLVVAQHGASSSRELGLRSIERTGDELSVELTVSRSNDQYEYDDLGVHSLLMRVTEDADDVPTEIDVTD